MIPTPNDDGRAATAPRLIPVYDATAPIACTISDADIPDRIRLLERMRADLRSLDRTEHGLLLRFAATPSTEADVRTFAVEEKACCRFWGFEVTVTDDVVLRWDAPPDAAHLLGLLAEWFTGDAPVEDLRTLL